MIPTRRLISASLSKTTPRKQTSTDIERGNFLTVTGIVDGEGRLIVDPGFHLTYRRPEPGPVFEAGAVQHALVVEFRDSKDQIITQCLVPLAPVCAVGGNVENHWFFAASIPFPSDYRVIRYYLGERLLRHVERPIRPPTVKFAKVPRSTAAETEVIAWEVNGDAGTDIRTIVLFSHNDGQTWQAVVPPSMSRSNSASVRFSDLPGGHSRLRALATDGFTTALDDSEPFEVSVKGIRLSILQPAHGATLAAGNTIHLYGQAYDYEKQNAAAAELVWRSSRDGELGRGRVISTRLSPGIHELTLTCNDRESAVTVLAQPNRRHSSLHP
jgi:hypothetical protein